MLVFMAIMLASMDLSCKKQESLPLMLKAGVYLDVAPRWSHNEERIAFFRTTPSGSLQLYTTDSSLKKAAALTYPAMLNPDSPLTFQQGYLDDVQAPAWSADDKWICYPKLWWTDDEKNRLPGSDLMISTENGIHLSEDSHNKKCDIFYLYYRSAQWAPNNKRFAFVGEAGSGQTAIFVHPYPFLAPECELPMFDQYTDSDFPRWSPDGRWLAFRQGKLRAITANKIETISMLPLKKDMYPRSLNVSQLISGCLVNGIAWSKDSRFLAVSVSTVSNDVKSISIWVYSLDKNTWTRFSPKDGNGYYKMNWLDDNHLECVQSDGNQYNAVILSDNSAVPHVLFSIPTDDIDWSPDGRKLVCADPNVPTFRTRLKIFNIQQETNF
jgi:Tol biopolymer transport system component